MDHLGLWDLRRDHGPSPLVAVGTDKKGARSCGAHVSGLGAESRARRTNDVRNSFRVNRMAYARRQIRRNGKKGKRKRGIVGPLDISLKHVSVKFCNWESREVFLDFNIKVYIHHSTTQTEAI